jgi:GT2 family glycosyltransferase
LRSENSIISNNLSVPTKQFHAVGGFDTTFSNAGGKDRGFCEHWRHYGYRVIYAPEVLVYHAHGLILFSFWRQYFNYGRGAFLFHQKCLHYRRQRIQVEPLAFYLRLLSYPFSRIGKQPAIRLSVLIFLSQVANALGFSSKRMKRRC